MYESVLKIKPPLVFSRSDADEMTTAVQIACQELLGSLKTVDIENIKCMEATAPGRAEAAKYFEELFLECNAKS